MTSNTFYTLAVFAIVLLIITKPIGLWLTPIAQGRAPAVVDAIDRRLISVLAPSGREESWQRYAVSLLTFNTLGLIFLYVLQRIQGWLPLNPQGFEGVAPDQAFNTAVSFVTNTNWQSYGGEMTMSYLTQMLGMGVQNFGSSDFLVKQGARWYPGRGQNWLVRRMQRSSLLNYRNRCQNLVGARRKHTRPHPHQAEPDQVPALQSAAYAAE